jgi:hypothetical protein
MPDDLAEPVVPSPCFLLCTGAAGEAFTRHSLRPLFSEGSTLAKASGAFAPRERDRLRIKLFDKSIKRHRAGRLAQASRPLSPIEREPLALHDLGERHF